MIKSAYQSHYAKYLELNISLLRISLPFGPHPSSGGRDFNSFEFTLVYLRMLLAVFVHLENVECKKKQPFTLE